MPETPETYATDRALVANRLATLAQAGDARKADAYADSFTADGVLQLDDRTIAGRETIRAWMAAPSVIPQPDTPARRPGHVSHHLTTMRIDFTGPATAKARTYWFVITPVGPDHSGYYDDSLEKVEGDWLVAHRRPRTIWIAPHSLIAAAHEG
ncbi:MAG: nuclear transport factor 2 family protein [Sphingomonadales bacterium]|nr:nuclear transport factor 2 family protein [Sphingomonadales bacterium]